MEEVFRWTSGRTCISVDKDILNAESATTNWDQGPLSLPELEELLAIILKKEEIIGVDICGECARSLDIFEEKRAISLNSKANKELLELFFSYIWKQLIPAEKTPIL